MPSPLRSRARPGRVADEAEAVTGELPRRPAPHDVGVAAKRLDGEIVGQAARGAQGLDQRLPPAWQIRSRPRDAPDPDVEHVALGEVPAVAFEVPLDVELGRLP